MRIIFMGSPIFSVPALESLIKAGHEIISVYTQTPKEKDRGHHIQKVAVHQKAEELNLPVCTPKTLKREEEQKEFCNHNADIAVVAAYGLILPREILKAPKLGCINIHASLLPRWRGAAPIHRAIMEGDQITGITVMQMDEGLDTGDMYLKESIPITNKTTTSMLHDQLSLIGAKLIVKALNEIEMKQIMPIPQPDIGITYAHKLKKEEGLLDWTQSALQIDRKIRALNPWPGTWFDHNGISIKVLEASYIKNKKGEPGTFYQTSEYPWIVSCAEGAIALNKVQKPGGKPLAASDFLKGYKIDFS
jgi:methionyl-tRNA formyltransferase